MTPMRILAGNLDRFALEFGADGGHAPGRGRLRLWVGAEDVLARAGGDPDAPPSCDLPALIDWFCSRWDPLLHESRLPGRRPEGTAASWWRRLDSEAGPRADKEGVRLWWGRHCLSSAQGAEDLPSVFLRRMGDHVEISWEGGSRRAPALEVATTLFSFLATAVRRLSSAGWPPDEVVQFQARVAGLQQTPPQERLAWMAGLGMDHDSVLKGWSRVEAAARTVAARFPGDAALVQEVLFGLTGSSSPLVVPGSTRAVMMFGTVSPDIGAADCVRIAECLVRSTSARGVAALVDQAAASVRREVVWSGPPWSQGYRIAEAARSVLGSGQVLRPLDLEETLRTAGVQLGDLALEDTSIRGLALAGPDHPPTIMVNPNHPRNEGAEGRRFTIAHELCHLLVDRASGIDLAVASGEWAPQWIEKRANAFAAALLLPEDEVRDALNRSGGDPDAAARALRRRFGAGRVAVLRHLQNLGFLSQHEAIRLIEDRPSARGELFDEAEALRSVESLLDSGNLREAMAIAGQLNAAEIRHPRLRRLVELAEPAQVLPSSPQTSAGWAEDMEWIQQHRGEFRGKWVAVQKGRLLASADSLRDLRGALSQVTAEEPPLVQKLA